MAVASEDTAGWDEMMLMMYLAWGPVYSKHLLVAHCASVSGYGPWTTQSHALPPSFYHPTPPVLPCRAKSMMLGSRASTSVLMSVLMLMKSMGARPRAGWETGLQLMSGRACRGGVWAGAGESGVRCAWGWTWWCRGMDCRDRVISVCGGSWETARQLWAMATEAA